MAKLDMKQAVTGSYPTCEVCGNSLRRPCMIAYESEPGGEAKGMIACVSCYRVWACLSWMSAKGLIGVRK